MFVGACLADGPHCPVIGRWLRMDMWRRKIRIHGRWKMIIPARRHVRELFNKHALEKLMADPNWAREFYAAKFTDVVEPYQPEIITYEFSIGAFITGWEDHDPA